VPTSWILIIVAVDLIATSVVLRAVASRSPRDGRPSHALAEMSERSADPRQVASALCAVAGVAVGVAAVLTL